MQLEKRAGDDKTGYQDLPLVQAQNLAPSLSDALCSAEQANANFGNLSRLGEGKFPEGKSGLTQGENRVWGCPFRDKASDKMSSYPSCRSGSGRWLWRQGEDGQVSRAA